MRDVACVTACVGFEVGFVFEGATGGKKGDSAIVKSVLVRNVSAHRARIGMVRNVMAEDRPQRQRVASRKRMKPCAMRH